MTDKSNLNDTERGISDLCDEVNRLRDYNKALEKALGAVCYAAARQLAGMGKGREPSERLQEAFAAAAELLGRDPTELAATPGGNAPR